MCIIFKTNGNVSYYVEKGRKYLFPTPPTMRCKKCKRYIKFKKHGFRERWYISKLYKGLILIRRYICPCKGFTISMMPDFCLRCFTVALEHIFKYTYSVLTKKDALYKILNSLNSQNDPVEISRQQLYFYRKRLIQNIKHIEIGIRAINEKIRFPDSVLSDRERVKGLLEIVKTEFTRLNEFSLKFQDKTNNTPLTLLK
jgi:hypothetical protein